MKLEFTKDDFNFDVLIEGHWCSPEPRHLAEFANAKAEPFNSEMKNLKRCFFQTQEAAKDLVKQNDLLREQVAGMKLGMETIITRMSNAGLSGEWLNEARVALERFGGK